MLSKYSGRRSKLNIIKTGDIPLRKEAFITEHLSYLDIDE
jgi:hypothetical protein